MAKAKRTTKKKTAKKAAPRFYVVKTVRDARESLNSRMENVNEKFVKRPIENARDFAEELKDDPRKTIDNLMEDGREFVNDLKKDAQKKIDVMVKDGKKFLKKAQKNPRKTFDGLVEDGKDFLEEVRDNTRKRVDSAIDEARSFFRGVEKDARLVVDDVVDNGKKKIEKVTGIKKIEQEIESRLQSIPSRFNIPSKKDIEKLARGMKDLSQKVDTLGRNYAA